MGPVVLPAGQCAPRARFDDPDDQQGVRGMGSRSGRRRHGHGDAGPSAAPLPRGEHPGVELAHAGLSGETQGADRKAGKRIKNFFRG